MPTEPASLLVVANSGRAIAESAVRGGYRVQVLDAFCDQDTRALATCRQIPLVGAGLDPERLRAEVGRLLAAGGVDGLIYGAGLESAPDLLAWLAGQLPLYGNDPAVLDLLGDPPRLFALLDDLGVAVPETRFIPPPTGSPGIWLLKEPASSGGLGVRPWRGDDDRAPGTPHYFQRYLAGTPLSVLFIADGRRAAVIGYSRLLLAQGTPGRPFLYGGAIAGAELGELVRTLVERIVQALVSALGLRGVNNLDFILHGGRVRLLELNPRPSATLSLYESDCPEGWIRRHVRACLGRMPDLGSDPPGRPCAGHRILYARRDLVIPAELDWPSWSRDRPEAGTWIPRGAPLCTLLAEGPDAAGVAACLAERSRRLLVRLSSAVHETLDVEAMS